MNFFRLRFENLAAKKLVASKPSSARTFDYFIIFFDYVVED